MGVPAAVATGDEDVRDDVDVRVALRVDRHLVAVDMGPEVSVAEAPDRDIRIGPEPSLWCHDAAIVC
jgi:hypothetical protein